MSQCNQPFLRQSTDPHEPLAVQPVCPPVLIIQHLHHATTCTPKLLQLPMTALATASSPTSPRFSSLLFIFAISYTCFSVILPVGSPCPEDPDPFSISAACLISHDTGGVLVTKLNVRSGWTVMIQGIGVSGM